MKYKGWNEFEIGSVLFPFEDSDSENVNKQQENRPYTENSSYKASVAHWRVDKPVFNSNFCINCYSCWLYCPDSSIVVRGEKMTGIDYVHCKGCGVCSSVCPTNPKSLLMYSDYESEEMILQSWPQKQKKGE